MKLRKDPVTVETLEEYLADASDFAFELQILRMLSEKGIHCEHSGHYRDPDTKKFREFDLRTRITKGSVTMSLAIECKAIGNHFPLLVSCVPRKPLEAVHEIFIHSFREKRSESWIKLPHIDALEGMDGHPISPSKLYPINAPVGKSTAQIGRRDTASADLVATDAEFFDKWSQALQSLDDLVDEIADPDFIKSRSTGDMHIAMAVPIVVVPNGNLWAVLYDQHGQLNGRPSQVDRVPIYIARTYQSMVPPNRLVVSHIEVLTEKGLSEYCEGFLQDADTMVQTFLATE